jgi:DNA-binding MarR family transcriptional regulator
MDTMTATANAPSEETARWLSEYEQSTWRSFLAMQRLIRDTLERQLQRDAAMPMTYYIILAMLSEAPERTLRMSELAVIAGTSQSQLSHAASRLEESGWIERRRCESDKRGYLATLTDEGFAVLQKAAPSHVESVRSVLFDAITPEQVDQLRTIGEAVLAHSCGDDSPMKYIVG